MPESVECLRDVHQRRRDISDDHGPALPEALQLECVLEEKAELGLSVGNVDMLTRVQRCLTPIPDTILKTHQGRVDSPGLLKSALVVELTVACIL